ncbi:DUF2254 domain-containing protein [Martelella limonii]|uniref:DUF2254 domain-containing protein n=1 Tax=Martelella limonii TaxID=1647649 RepID=UPI001580F4AA|nr:DUF2254 domain-containing protein [Martelella limonii]
MKLNLTKRWWIVIQALREVWSVAALYCVVAVLTAFLGVIVEPFVPYEFREVITPEAVGSLLTIIASSMLSVLVFSLNTLVQASTAAASNATPRAVGTLLQDRTAQSALSTFLGAFIFSLVGLIALNTHLYGGGGRLIQFVVTLAVILLIIIMLVRWINYLGHLGQVTKTIAQVESPASRSMAAFRQAPFMLAQKRQGDLPTGLLMVEHKEIGYLRFIDLAALDSIADRLGADIHVVDRCGMFVTPGRPIAGIALANGKGTPSTEILEELRKAFTVGDTRSYDQDPLYGLTVLSQIAMRALSPGINDPGTAIDVIGNLVRVMAAGEPESKVVHHDRVYMPEIKTSEFFDAAFTGISRDGADKIEVGMRLQRAFESLSFLPYAGYGDTARFYAATALERSLAKLDFESDRARLAETAFKG